MVKRLNDGYECVVCGKNIDNYNDTRRHERTCGIKKIDSFIDFNLSFEKEESEHKETRQLRVGEKFIGRCVKCDATLTSKNLINEPRQIFECHKCGKLNKSKDESR